MYSNCCMVLLLVIVLIDASDTGEPRVLHIGALFNAEHSSVNAHGQDDLQVAQLAIDEINHRHAELFHGLYKLSLLSNNSQVDARARGLLRSRNGSLQCDPIYAVDAFFHAIFRRAQLLFLVGTSCSNETKAVIQVADYYNLILVSMPSNLSAKHPFYNTTEIEPTVHIQSSSRIRLRSFHKAIRPIPALSVCPFPTRTTMTRAWPSSRTINGRTSPSSIRTRQTIPW